MPLGSSNIDEIERWFDQIIASINFTLPGKDQSLGRDLVGVVANGIIDRSVPDAKGPDGNPWAENHDPYKAWKAKEYDAFQPGILTGQMLSLESIKGETTINPDSVEMKYGTDTPASGSRNGKAPPDAKEPPTDRQKAEWFHDRGNEFYGLDEAIAADCVDECAEGLADYIGGQA
jgi:hypothetical protein